jgi:hypothetical protein
MDTKVMNFPDIIAGDFFLVVAHIITGKNFAGDKRLLES